MGLSSKTTVQSNDPWKPAQKPILDSLNATRATYDLNQPDLQKYAGMARDTYGQVQPGAVTGIKSAQTLTNDTLGGKYLTGNPYLEGIISKSNRGIIDGVNGQFEMSGRYGSGGHAGLLADKLAENENSLRYGDYATERGYQHQAVGDAQNLESGAQGILNNAAQLPWIGVQAQNGGVTNLTSPYGTRTTTQNDPMGAAMGIGGLGLSAFSAGAFKSDARVKNVGGQVGTSPDGLPLYDFTYKADPAQTPQVGPMAQEVEQVRPDAVGQTPDGVKTVDYGALGLPAPGAMAQQHVPQIDKPGVGGFLDRFVSPDATTTRGKLGLLGQAMMAGDGSPFQSLGKGLLGIRQQAATEADATDERDIKRREADARIGYYNARASGDDKPQFDVRIGGDGRPVITNRRTGEAMNPAGIMGRPAPQPRLYATANGYQPPSAAIGEMPYAKPPAPPRASTAPPKYMKSKSGQLMKWVP